MVKKINISRKVKEKGGKEILTLKNETTYFMMILKISKISPPDNTNGQFYKKDKHNKTANENKKISGKNISAHQGNKEIKDTVTQRFDKLLRINKNKTI